MQSLPIPDNSTTECDIVSRYPNDEIPMPSIGECVEPISAHNPYSELAYRIKHGMHRIVNSTNAHTE